MRDYQSMGGMEPQSAGAPSYSAPGRGQETAYGAELRFGTPSASVIARVPNLSTDPLAASLAAPLAGPLASPLTSPLATPAATDEAHTAEQGWRAWFTRKAVAGVAAVVLLAAVSPWIVGLLRDKTESEATADAKGKAPEVRVEFPAPNESEAPAWGGARSDSARWQKTADSRDARRRPSLVDPDDADPDADRRDSRHSEPRRTGAELSQDKRAGDMARDEADDARAPARTTARTATRRTTADRDAERSVESQPSRAAGIARRSDARPATLSERSPLAPPENDRTSVSGASNAPSRPRFESAEDRSETRTASRATPRYEARGDAAREESTAAGRRRPAEDASETAVDRPVDKRRSTAQDKYSAPSQDKYAAPRDREEVASRRGVSRDRLSETIPTAYEDEPRGSGAPRSKAADRSSSSGASRFDADAAPARRAAPSRSRDDRDESPYGFSRRDSEGGASRAPAASRATEPSDSEGDIAPRYRETRAAAPQRDDYSDSRAPSKAAGSASRGVRSASYETTDQDLARFQGGIEEPTHRTSYERTGSSIR